MTYIIDDPTYIPAIRRSIEALNKTVRENISDQGLDWAIDYAEEIAEMLRDLKHARITRGMDHPYTREEAEADLAKARELRLGDSQIVPVVVNGDPRIVVAYRNLPEPWESSGEMVYCSTPLDFANCIHNTLSKKAAKR